MNNSSKQISIELDDPSTLGLSSESGEEILADVLRGFRALASPRGLLDVTPLVKLSQLTENVFDHLRHRSATLSGEELEIVLAATTAVRSMFADVMAHRAPAECEPVLIRQLEGIISGLPVRNWASVMHLADADRGPDWNQLYQAVISNERGSVETKLRQDYAEFASS